MSSCKDPQQRSQRRRELDARRSKSRVRLGSCLQSWVQLKEKLGFSLHSELAQHLLDSYVSRVCIKCSGAEKREVTRTFSTTEESLQELIVLVHKHGQTCLFPPAFHSQTVTKATERDQIAHAKDGRETETVSKDSCEVDICLRYSCKDEHHFVWSPTTMEKVRSENEGDVTSPSPKRISPRGRSRLKKPDAEMIKFKIRRQQQENSEVLIHDTERTNQTRSGMFVDIKNAGATVIEPEGNDVAADFSCSVIGSPAESDEMPVDDDPARVCPFDSNEDIAVLNLSTRGTQSIADRYEKRDARKKAGTFQNDSPRSLKDNVSQIGGKRKRKSTSKVILPCKFEGCDKIFSSRQYLNHHMKYQHLQQKTFICLHPTCSKSFNFKKHLKEHEKLHSNQRDYICEFCARAFRTSSNLIIHRRIHTGEKPLQCEVCGFTCRQKASLNWHMRKHNAESTYRFPCEICGRRFEKRDNVTAHRSKSHPDYNIPTPEQALPLSDPLPHPSGQHGSSPSASKKHNDPK